MQIFFEGARITQAAIVEVESRHVQNEGVRQFGRFEFVDSFGELRSVSVRLDSDLPNRVGDLVELAYRDDTRQVRVTRSEQNVALFNTLFFATTFGAVFFFFLFLHLNRLGRKHKGEWS